MKKKINWKNLIKLLILAFCIGIIAFYFVCISVIFATLTWLGFTEFVLAVLLSDVLIDDLFGNKKEN